MSQISENILLTDKRIVGKYRVKVVHDVNSNDFYRNKQGEIDYTIDDLYIECSKGKQIYYFGYISSMPNHSVCRQTLVAYIPSIKSGHNISESLIEQGLKCYVEENDAEVFIYFNPDDIDLVCKEMSAKVSGAKIQPFDEKNLDWDTTYNIPDKDLLPYKQLTENISMRKFKEIYSQFESKHRLDFDRKRKLARLPIKEYIHSIGCWGKYLKFLGEYNGEKV